MPPSLHIAVARGAEELHTHQAAWDDLAARALDDDLYAGPAFVGSVARCAEPQPLRTVLVYDGPPRGGRLLLAAPFTLRAPARRIPLGGLTFLDTPYAKLTLPMIDAGGGAEALDALWGWLARRRPGPAHLIGLPHVRATSRTWALLRARMARRGLPWLVRHVEDRPILRRHASFDAYLASLPRSRRKGYRRRRRALGAAGRLEVLLHRDLSRAPDLAHRFMALEALGWKGAAGTALTTRPTHAAFFTDLTRRLARARRLFFVELRLDGRTIALTSNFVAGSGLFAFKTAFDPAFAGFSPGIVAEVEGVRLFHETPRLTWGDAGAGADAFVGAYWRHREPMLSVYVAVGSVRSVLALRGVAAGRAAARVVRPVAAWFQGGAGAAGPPGAVGQRR